MENITFPANHHAARGCQKGGASHSIGSGSQGSANDAERKRGGGIVRAKWWPRVRGRPIDQPAARKIKIISQNHTVGEICGAIIQGGLDAFPIPGAQVLRHLRKTGKLVEGQLYNRRVLFWRIRPIDAL